MRMPIECAFGILVMTWGCLWRALSVKFERRAPLISALIILHNLRVDARAPSPTYNKRPVEGIRTDTTGRRAMTKWVEWEVLPGEIGMLSMVFACGGDLACGPVGAGVLSA